MPGRNTCNTCNTDRGSRQPATCMSRTCIPVCLCRFFSVCKIGRCGSGAKVTVYERRPADKADSAPGWNIVLGRIAARAIKAAGLSAAFPPELRHVPTCRLPPAGAHAPRRARASPRPRRAAGCASAPLVGLVADRVAASACCCARAHQRAATVRATHRYSHTPMHAGARGGSGALPRRHCACVACMYVRSCWVTSAGCVHTATGGLAIPAQRLLEEQV